MAADPCSVCASDLSDVFRERQPLSKISAVFLCHFLFAADYLCRAEFGSEGGLADPGGIIDECGSGFFESNADAYFFFRIGKGGIAGNDAGDPKRGDSLLYSFGRCKKLDKGFGKMDCDSKALSFCKSGEHWGSVDDAGVDLVDQREYGAGHLFPESGNASVSI